MTKSVGRPRSGRGAPVPNQGANRQAAGPDDGLSTPIQFIHGVGPRLASLLGRLGVRTVRDALFFFPRYYDDRRTIKTIRQVIVGQRETVAGEVKSGRAVYTRKRGGRLYEVELGDGTGSVTGLWFHFREPYMRQRFTPGSRLMFHGEVRWDGARLVIYHPEVEDVPREGEVSLHVGRIVPVYPLTEDLGQRQVRKIIHRVLQEWAPLVRDLLPETLQRKYHLPGLAESIAQVHFPPPSGDLEALNGMRSPWHKRLVFDEFFFLELWLLASRAERERTRRRRLLADGGELRERFLGSLPFGLTGSQRRAFEEIRRNMLSPRPMYRLLQGDVGCGKTVVAALAVLLAAENGLQSVIMAPTEILARQHFNNLSRLFNGLGVELAFLVSGLTARQKQAARERVADGRAMVVIGTHALIQEAVAYRDLGLAVIDEQHRFGVEHRMALRDKGDNPDALVITATPIPRTLAMTLYGDMDITVIDQMPPGRQPVETSVIGEDERELLYRRVAAELEGGHQAFIIYPLVEESERSELRAAERMASHLAREVFPRYPLGLVHGRLKAQERAAVMDDFASGRLRILVSTTVVEVGVDVPAATIMVVEHADRFGLSQLHQLRGRVGRGGQKAFCLLVASEGAGEEARRRLDIMTRTADGFRLAEEDLRERGPGEFSGLRQSGAPDFLLANLIRHRKALEFAREEAHSVLGGKLVDRIELTKLLHWAKIKWSERASYLYGG